MDTAESTSTADRNTTDQLTAVMTPYIFNILKRVLY